MSSSNDPELTFKQAHYNLAPPILVEKALARSEGLLTPSGALRVTTGKYTGRSPNDKFFVDTPEVHDQVWWESNQSITPTRFAQLYSKLRSYLQDKEVFIFDGFAGADPEYRLPLRAVCEYSWHALSVHQLFLRPAPGEAQNFSPEFTLICAPGFHANPAEDGTNSEAFIIINLSEHLVLIGGTQYAGEMKKSIFTVMNYLMPLVDVFPMHCSANAGAQDDVALFFGLSGTGKTTLSADPHRRLIGDDEHGWSKNGIFNFEGGCYAKCINLSQEAEPQIWNAIRFGCVVENIVINQVTRLMDYDSQEITENTRAVYPVDYIPQAIVPGVGRHPRTIIFLTADAFGVLPPVARLTREQAIYHFLSGYTSKLAGTERGITEPQATFSTCFGAPFLPMPPQRYAELFGTRLDQYGVNVFLINTGWSGGPYGIGQRINLKYTRAMVAAALNGQLDQVEYIQDDIFKLQIPTCCPGVPSEVLQPQTTWQNQTAYTLQARSLAGMFRENFRKFTGVSATVIAAGLAAS